MITREQFIRVGARALRRGGPGLTPEQQAALVADAIEDVLQNLQEMGVSAPAPPAPPATPWPTVNPAAVQPEGPPLVTLETRIPDRVERSREPEPEVPATLRKIEKPKLSVEALNMLIQERTPLEITVDIPNLDGSTFPQVLKRNVLSAHAEECVKLVYYHPKSPNDLAVEESLSILDVPFDLPAILVKLKVQAIALMKPRDGAIISVAPKMGGVNVAGDNLETMGPALNQLVQAWTKP